MGLAWKMAFQRPLLLFWLNIRRSASDFSDPVQCCRKTRLVPQARFDINAYICSSNQIQGRGTQGSCVTTMVFVELMRFNVHFIFLSPYGGEIKISRHINHNSVTSIKLGRLLFPPLQISHLKRSLVQWEIILFRITGWHFHYAATATTCNCVWHKPCKLNKMDNF